MGRFGVFFPSHTAPAFQVWFYFHVCMWVVHWGLLLRLPWRTWVCPCEGQVWRWCSCLGRRGSGSTRYSGGLAARVAGNIVWQSVLANTLQYSCLENPTDREAWQATVHRVTKNQTRPKQPCTHRCKTFFCLWQLCSSEGSAAAWFSGTWQHQV